MELEDRLTEEEYRELIQPYQDCMRNMLARLETLALDYRKVYQSEPIHHIQERIKSKDSIEGKLLRKGFSTSVPDARDCLRDIAGIRVICYFERDIYQIVSILKKQQDLEIIKERDYIRYPKKNGYRSYHMVFAVPIYRVMGMEYFPVEIQFRTMAMDLWASMEHRVCYKSDEEGGQRESIQAFQRYAVQLKQMEEDIQRFCSWEGKTAPAFCEDAKAQD